MLPWKDSILLSKVNDNHYCIVYFSDIINHTFTLLNCCLIPSINIGGFLASILLFCLIMSVGFLTFGGSSLGFVLNNYSGKDFLATAARLAIGE